VNECTPQEFRELLAELLGDVEPASPGLVAEVAKSIADRRKHEHAGTDFYCLNRTVWAGEQAASVIRRLLDAEAQIERLRAELEQSPAEASPAV
jgi:transposase